MRRSLDGYHADVAAAGLQRRVAGYASDGDVTAAGVGVNSPDTFLAIILPPPVWRRAGPPMSAAVMFPPAVARPTRPRSPRPRYCRRRSKRPARIFGNIQCHGHPQPAGAVPLRPSAFSTTPSLVCAPKCEALQQLRRVFLAASVSRWTRYARTSAFVLRVLIEILPRSVFTLM